MTTKTLRLKIHDEAELYSSFDPDQNMLSDDVVSYLTKTFLNQHRKILERYVIDIISDTPVNEEHAKRTIRNELELQKDDNRFALKRLTLKEICLSIIGVLILSVWIVLSAKAETVGIEVLSIVGGLAVYEAASIAILQRPEIQRLQTILERLVHAEINFHLAED